MASGQGTFHTLHSKQSCREKTTVIVNTCYKYTCMHAHTHTYMHTHTQFGWLTLFFHLLSLSRTSSILKTTSYLQHTLPSAMYTPHSYGIATPPDTHYRASIGGLHVHVCMYPIWQYLYMHTLVGKNVTNMPLGKYWD